MAKTWHWQSHSLVVFVVIISQEDLEKANSTINSETALEITLIQFGIQPIINQRDWHDHADEYFLSVLELLKVAGTVRKVAKQTNIRLDHRGRVSQCGMLKDWLHTCRPLGPARPVPLEVVQIEGVAFIFGIWSALSNRNNTTLPNYMKHHLTSDTVCPLFLLSSPVLSFW